MSPNNFPGKMCDVLRWHCTNISKGKIAGVYQEGLGVILGFVSAPPLGDVLLLAAHVAHVSAGATPLF